MLQVDREEEDWWDSWVLLNLPCPWQGALNWRIAMNDDSSNGNGAHFSVEMPCRPLFYYAGLKQMIPYVLIASISSTSSFVGSNLPAVVLRRRSSPHLPIPTICTIFAIFAILTVVVAILNICTFLGMWRMIMEYRRGHSASDDITGLQYYDITILRY